MLMEALCAQCKGVSAPHFAQQASVTLACDPGSAGPGVVSVTSQSEGLEMDLAIPLTSLR